MTEAKQEDDDDADDDGGGHAEDVMKNEGRM